jgi:hypothetical protein
MPTTLKIKNRSTGNVTVDPGPGGAPVVIAAGEAGGLAEAHLRSAAFQQELAAGHLEFDVEDAPNALQTALARKVLPALLLQLGAKLIALCEQGSRSKQELRRRREFYNVAWKLTEAVLKDSEAAADGAAALVAGLQHYGGAKLEQAAVEAANQEILKLEAEDLAETNRTLKQWYADREASQIKLKAAQAALAAAKLRHVDPYGALQKSLEKCSKSLALADPSSDIGQPVPSFD